MKYIKKFLGSDRVQVGMMELVISVAIGLIVLAAVFSLAPVIGDKVDTRSHLIQTAAGRQMTSPQASISGLTTRR